MTSRSSPRPNSAALAKPNLISLAPAPPDRRLWLDLLDQLREHGPVEEVEFHNQQQSANEDTFSTLLNGQCHFGNPEKRLNLAILAQAILDFIHPESEEVYMDSLTWFSNPNKEPKAFSFAAVSNEVGLSSSFVFSAICEIRESTSHRKRHLSRSLLNYLRKLDG